MPLFFYFYYYCVNFTLQVSFQCAFGDVRLSKPLLKNFIQYFFGHFMVNESSRHYQNIGVIVLT